MQYQDVRVEISADYRMVAVRQAPEVALTIVGAPQSFRLHGMPMSIGDLSRHNCICLRMASSGGIYARELTEDGKSIEVKASRIAFGD